MRQEKCIATVVNWSCAVKCNCSTLVHGKRISLCAFFHESPYAAAADDDDDDDDDEYTIYVSVN